MIERGKKLKNEEKNERRGEFSMREIFSLFPCGFFYFPHDLNLTIRERFPINLSLWDESSRWGYFFCLPEERNV